MGEDRKTTGRRKRIVPKGQVQMIISREYIGTQTVAEAFVPIISEDIRKKIADSGSCALPASCGPPASSSCLMRSEGRLFRLSS